MILSIMIVNCEMIWEHIGGTDMDRGVLSDGLGLATTMQAFIPILKLKLRCTEKRETHGFNILLLLCLNIFKPMKNIIINIYDWSENTKYFKSSSLVGKNELYQGILMHYINTTLQLIFWMPGRKKFPKLYSKP